MYKEITKIIFKMKSSTSPCPFDQISIIVLIKCSYRRIYLWMENNICFVDSRWLSCCTETKYNRSSIQKKIQMKTFRTLYQ